MYPEHQLCTCKSPFLTCLHRGHLGQSVDRNFPHTDKYVYSNSQRHPAQKPTIFSSLFKEHKLQLIYAL